MLAWENRRKNECKMKLSNSVSNGCMDKTLEFVLIDIQNVIFSEIPLYTLITTSFSPSVSRLFAPFINSICFEFYS